MADDEERQRWWLSVMQQAVASQGYSEDESSAVLQRGRMAARRRQGDGESYGMSTPSRGMSPSSPSLRSMKQLCDALQTERDQLQQSVVDLETKLTDLEGSRFEPPELEELQIYCSTLESQKRTLEQELAKSRSETAPLEGTEQSVDSIEGLTAENARLQGDLSEERRGHLRTQEELQVGQDRIKELEEQLSLLQRDYDERFQTFDSPKVEALAGPAVSMEQQQKMIDLEVENSRLQEDLSKERHGHSRAQAELQVGQDRIKELEEQLSLLQRDYDERFQTFDSQKVEALAGPAVSMEQQQKMIDLEVENSRLQEDLSKERHGHSRAQAELQVGQDRIKELEEQLSLLQRDYDERFQTFDSQKVEALAGPAVSMEQQQKMIDLEVENSRLQEDLSKERHGHSIAQAELQARIEQLMLEMLQLRQERVAEQLVDRAMEDAKDELKHQAIQMNGSPKVGCLSDVPKASSCTSSPSKAKPELAELLAVDSPGIYVVSQLVSLTVGPEKGSPKLQMISVGTTVQVLEVLHRPEDRRVRGRIEEPAGWISIVSTEDSNRWAGRDLQRSNSWACMRLEQLQRLQRELEVLEASKLEAAEAAGAAQQSCDLELSQSRQQLEAARAEAAEDLGRRERELHELRERLRSLELQLHQAQLQCDGPGVYILAGEVDVTEAVGRGSTKVGRLQPGQEVHVLEVVQKEQDRRVRARIQQPAGWISLLDTSEGHRWAHRQLAATNEWISELSSGGELELKARLAALEAHRDSLLAELNGNAAGSAVTGDVDVLELQELQAKVLLLEAGREEVELQAELMRTKYAALEAEHQDAALQVARGWSLQAEELQRQVNQQVQERGRLEAELARLRAEHGALAETPMVAESPLSQAERWVLYTEIPKVEAASSLTYFGQVQMDFDREEFVAPLAPLAAVNLAHRAAATAALERGDVARVALKRYIQQDAASRGCLEGLGPARIFLGSVFQHFGLTPPMEAHVLMIYRLFAQEERLNARASLCLCDALMRTVLRSRPRPGPASPVVRVAQIQPSSSWTWKEPEVAAEAPAEVTKCRFCDEAFEDEDSAFCTACGARREGSPCKSTSPVLSPTATSTIPATPIPSKCGRCGWLNESDSQFCSMCGAPLEGAVPVPPARMVSPRRLDQSRIRTCQPVSAEMQVGLQPTPVPVTARIGPTPVPLAKS